MKVLKHSQTFYLLVLIDAWGKCHFADKQRRCAVKIFSLDPLPSPIRPSSITVLFILAFCLWGLYVASYRCIWLQFIWVSLAPCWNIKHFIIFASVLPHGRWKSFSKQLNAPYRNWQLCLAISLQRGEDLTTGRFSLPMLDSFICCVFSYLIFLDS